MSTNSDILQEFLVSLGWKIDESGQRKFARAIAVQTATALELGRALEHVAGKVTSFVAQIAEGMEALYFASQRTGASAANIQSLGFAAGQMGSTAEAATAALEHLAHFLRVNPGGEGLLQSIGVQTRAANGGLRDTTDLLSALGERLKAMPYYQASKYAESFGIDEKTLLALREGLGEFAGEYRELLQAANLDSQEAAKGSHEFMNALRGVEATISVVAMKVASAALPALRAFATKLRQNLVANLPWITDVLSRVVTGIASLIGIAGQLGGRMLEIVSNILGWWNQLDGSSKQLIEAFAALVVAWKALNSAFLTSPIGLLLALGAALLLLYDDYRAWQKGGEHAIDWAAWEPELKQAQQALATLGEGFRWLGEALSLADGRGLKVVGILAALAAGFRVLGVVLSLTPIGRALTLITALGSALLFLYADFQTWQKGGKTFLDWNGWSQQITSAIGGITKLATVLTDILGGALADLGGVLIDLFDGQFKSSLAKAQSLVSKTAQRVRDALAPEATPATAARVPTPSPEASGPDALPARPLGIIAETPGEATPDTVDRRSLPRGVRNNNPGEATPDTVDRRSLPRGVRNNNPGEATPDTVDRRSLPRGVRNNNPGNLNFARQPGATKEAGPNGRFAVFQSVQQGLQALAAQLIRYAQRGIDTVAAIISKYAPKTDHNNTDAYIAQLSKQLHVGANQQLNLQDAQQLAGLMAGIVKVENGQQPYDNRQLGEAAMNALGYRQNPYAAEQLREGDTIHNNNNTIANTNATTTTENPVSIHQTNTITVTGAGDAPGTAAAVAQAQRGTNQMLIRNLRAVAY